MTLSGLPPLQAWWFVLMMVGGFGFGLVSERRPFGTDVLAHPLVVFYATAAAGLLVLRIVTQRAVPEMVPERVLAIGCLIGGATFLAGNFVGVHLLSGG